MNAAHNRRPLPAAGRKNDRDEWPVVVVGAGPAGLVTAIALARSGIECLVLDRRTSPAPFPRATVASLRSMELFRSWGLEDAIRAGSDEVTWQLRLAPTLAQASLGQSFDVGIPSASQSAAISPTRPACVPQDHLEEQLLAHLRTLPAATVVQGAAVTDVRDAGDVVHIRLRDLATGDETTSQAAYVVGADGAHSTVRAHTGIAVSTTDRLHESLSVVLHAPLWDVVEQHRYGIYTVGGAAHGSIEATFLPAGQGDRWVFGHAWDPTTERIEDYPVDRLTHEIRTGAGADVDVKIGHVGSFSFVAALADRFRDGRVFLVGDAAHRVTPRGGTGMNTAIAGGFDLGWKLSWVLLGWAPESLLDSYEVERRPAVQHNIVRSIDPGGSRRDVWGEVAVDLGGRVAHRWLQTPGGRRSTLDLLGPGLTLLTPRRRSATELAQRTPPTTVHRLDPVVLVELGADHDDSILLRPDGKIADAAAADTAFRLRAS